MGTWNTLLTLLSLPPSTPFTPSSWHTATVRRLAATAGDAVVNVVCAGCTMLLLPPSLECRCSSLKSSLLAVLLKVNITTEWVDASATTRQSVKKLVTNFQFGEEGEAEQLHEEHSAYDAGLD